jgi:hypothetical protein
MATSYSTNLALALPATGELSGTWGTTVNSNITNMLDEALGYQAYTATGGADTITIPDGTTGVARSIYIQLNGTGGGSVAVPTAKTKMYFVFNNTASAITFKVTGQTGVSIPAAAKMALVSNGTDIITAQNYFAALTLGAALPVASGGTGLTAGTSGGVLAYTASGTLASSGALTQYGVVIGGGAGAAPTSTAVGTAAQVLTSNGAGVAPTFQTPAAGFSAAANNTFTGTQTFNGTSSIFGAVLLDSAETVNVVAAAPSSTTNYYVQSGSVQYYTSNAANNWTLNVAFSSGTSMNTALAIGQSVTFVLVTTQSTTAYYNSAVTIDGTSVTPKWIGGAPTAGNASGLDVYRYAVVKTASATYTVLASLTQYK